MSIEEYLEGEQHSATKHEYVRGQVYAMVGASKPHNRIALNLTLAIHQHLSGGPCSVYMSDIKVRVDDIFYYPDVLVSCSATDTNPYYAEQPCLVVEVLSAATEAKDRLDKRLAYQSLPSLQEYVLVSQNKREVSVYRRTNDGWDLEIYSNDEALAFRSVDLSITLAAIYEGVPNA